MYFLFFFFSLSILPLLASAPPPMEEQKEIIHRYYQQNSSKIADFTESLNLHPMYSTLAWLQHQDEQGALEQTWMISTLLETAGHWGWSRTTTASPAEARIYNCMAAGFYLMHAAESPRPNSPHFSILQTAKNDAVQWETQFPGTRWDWHVRHFLAKRMCQYPDLSFNDYLRDPCNLDRAIREAKAKEPAEGQSIWSYIHDHPIASQLESEDVKKAHWHCTRNSTLARIPGEVAGVITSFLILSHSTRYVLSELYGVNTDSENQKINWHRSIIQNPYVNALIYLGRFMSPMASLYILGDKLHSRLVASAMRLSRLSGIDFRKIDCFYLRLLFQLNNPQLLQELTAHNEKVRATPSNTSVTIDSPEIWMDFLQSPYDHELKDLQRVKDTQANYKGVCTHSFNSTTIIGPNTFNEEVWMNFLQRLKPFCLQKLFLDNYRDKTSNSNQTTQHNTRLQILAPGGCLINCTYEYCNNTGGHYVRLDFFTQNLDRYVSYSSNDRIHFGDFLRELMMNTQAEHAKHIETTADWLLAEHHTAIQQIWQTALTLHKQPNIG